MRGDLVYEKLGEIDPELIADALPDAVPLYRLGGEDPKPPKKRPNLRKALVVCACLLLAGLLLIGGGIALSRSLEFPWETDTDETPTDQGKELTYQGIVTIDGFGPLTDSDDLESIGNEIKARFTAATPADVCDCIRDLKIQIGEDALTYNRDHGCFRDGKTGKVYRLRDEDRAYMEELLVMLEPPVIMDYTHATLHPLDDYTCTVSLVKNEDYPNLYEIKDIYLRSMAKGSDYRTDSFREIPDRDSFYCGTIPEDAPGGDYELVVSLFTPYTGRYTELTLTSRTPAVTVAAHEKEPRYAFFYECEKNIYRKGETVGLTAGLINRGDDIYRWSTELSILPTVTLRTVLDGETLTYPMTTGLELDWSGELYHMTYNESSKAQFWTVTPYSLPVGMYDLVLSFEGHEEVFENVLAVTDRDIDHEFEINYSIKESPILTEGKALTLQIRVTLRGGDLYRYGSSTCFLPDKLFFACETEDAFGHISPRLTHLQADADGNGIGPIVEDGMHTRLWREGETKTFTYAVEFDPNSQEDIMIAGEYDLTVGYDGETPIIFENALAVTDPDAPHGFAVDYSFTPKEGTVDDSVHTVTNNGTGTFILRITHDGDTLYRYGYDDCLRPDSVMLYRQEGESVGESATIFYTTHTEKTKSLWAWENDVTQSFLYEWDWSREPIEPGSYTLQVIYRDGDGGIQLHLTLEGALTVVAP